MEYQYLLKKKQENYVKNKNALDEESKKLLLNCTGIFRAQAVDIMPKNFYFVYKITELIQKKLNNINAVKCEIGSYSHFVTILVPTRND